MTSFKLAHFSDTHVALTQYPVLSPRSGRNQREQDVLRSFLQVTQDIAEWDPPLSIHSGDVADKAIITYRHQRQIQEAFKSLARRKDGSLRLNVVISGNHDMPKDPREPCHLEPALRPLESVVCVTNRYAQVDVDEYIARGQASAELAGLVVHCLPHDQLKRDDWADITPVPGKVNILVSHGVVGGSELYKRSQGREYAIPIDVLLRGWDYVAMGHFHKPGPVCVGGLKEATTPIWYAGSTENCGFSDLRDGVDGRGYLQVQVNPGQVPDVHKVDLPIRAMFRLPVLDAAGLGHEQITSALRAGAGAAQLDGAVVDQRVVNVDRDTWSLVDVAAARRTAGDALWYQVTPVFTQAAPEVGTDENGDPVQRLGDLGTVLEATAARLLPAEAERDPVMALARKLLGSALSQAPSEDTPAVDGPTDGDVKGGAGEAAAQTGGHGAAA